MVRRLAILGSYPPPYTGVTTHIERLCRLLDERSIDYIVYNATSPAHDGKRVVSVQDGRQSWFLKYALRGKERAALLFSDRLVTWVLGAFMVTLRGKRVILRLRNVALENYLASSWIRRKLCTFAVRRMWRIVCVNRGLLEIAAGVGVPRERLLWCPGFLPPAPDATDRAGVDDTVWKFVADRSPVIAANGKVNVHRGEDMYGLDHLVELASRLSDDYPNLGIVICFWDHLPKDEDALQALRNRAAELGVADRILFQTKPGRLMPVLAEADLFVRPTNTDGDANSIREALYLGVPTIASDVVERPDGTVLFPTRDLDAFESAVRKSLANTSATGTRRPEAKHGGFEHVDRYLNLLAEAIGDAPAAPANTQQSTPVA
ncbi:MAG: glycosyltransferase family 4 protein [Phycisphaerales bacterium]|nr:glycosyltransferase family 4 protein [Phycisphaerales bacterium]